MSFFEDLEPTTTYTSGSFQKLIPAETQLKCVVMAATWEPETRYRGAIVQVQLMVTQAGEFNGYVIKDNIKVFDADGKKAKRAKEKLMAYDTIGAGLLFKASKAGKDIVNDDLLLEKSIAGIDLIVIFDVWEQEGDDGETRTGNWVRSIGDAGTKKAVAVKAEAVAEELFDDGIDIPF